MKKKVECHIEPTPFHVSAIELSKFVADFAQLFDVSEAEAKKMLDDTNIVINGKEFRLVGYNDRCQKYNYVLKHVGGKASEYPFYKVSHAVLQFFE